MSYEEKRGSVAAWHKSIVRRNDRGLMSSVARPAPAV